VVWIVAAGANLNAGIGATVGGGSDLVIEGTVLAGTSATTDPQFGFDIAPSSAGAGTVDVVGTNALLNSTGPFIVGDLGFGALTIRAGGTVVSTPGTAAAISAVIGNAAGVDGANVSVNGEGSAWYVGGALLVGNEAGGALTISAAGTVSASTLDTGAGASGIVSVTGAGSALMLSGSLIVGDAASAELSILSGGMVSAVDADIGLGASATGNVDIEGAASHLGISDNLNIGDAGVGTLTLGNSTELTVLNTLNIGANGVLNQFGGLIDPSVVNNTGRAGGNGAITASVSIGNSSTIFASGNAETVTSPIIAGTGVLEIDPNGDLVLNVGSVVGTETVTFTDGTGVLTIGTLGGFAATIGDFISGDSIVVQGTSIASTSFDASTHVLTLFDPSSVVAGTLQFGSSVTNGSTIVVNGVTPCFVAGTRISTERGEVRVEELRVGDRVQVLSPEMHPQPQPIIWLGHRTVDCARHPEPHKVWPVRVAAHAFGPNRPERHVYLSPDHGLYIDNMLIPVKHLINGTSIAQVQRDTVTYHHIELPQHAVLLAEGLPAESYLDTGDRPNFANSSGPSALYPDFASRVWEAKGCAPVVVTGPAVEAARRWIDSLAGSTAWAA
jgi:T5SS/PEP-CTERM-associated repeat protein